MSKKIKSMAELTLGYEKFISNKHIAEKPLQLFEKVLKKASKPKRRGSK
ncbi:MAG: hypothetical protein J0L54_00080 [Chitinophagales bacterium]|nr:hypothetical protein [Chitinophagales bacterium]